MADRTAPAPRSDDDIESDAEAQYWPATPQWLDQEEEEEENGEDDMDFDPDAELEEEDDEDEDDDFEDAQQEIEIELFNELGAGDEETGAEDDEATDSGWQPQPQQTRSVFVTREQILQLLGEAGLRHILGANRRAGRMAWDDDDDEDESDYSTGYGGVQPRRRKGRGPSMFQKVPSEEGRSLMEHGVFGTNNRREDTHARKKRLAAQIMRRELGLGSYGRQRNADRLISQGLVPESKADMIINYDARCYSGQFSRDGNFFFSCAQDFKVRMYDTSNPYDWKYYKTVDYPYGQWTITDASLSPDNRFLAYSSIRSIVCLASTDPADDSHPQQLDFTKSRRSGRGEALINYPYFGIWSLRFSGDGREIVAGTGDSSVYVYDLETNQSVLRIQGHSNDVNAVCYGDANSPHILYSGSDDTTIKIWDRRSLRDGQEAGVFFGHTEGLTYVDSKGDGRYVLSNSKDQTAKLWDLRKMMPREEAVKVDVDAHTTGFEYRNESYDVNTYKPHPHDSSLVTFRGHKVLKTLIRCHFSPPTSSDSRYIYSGSADGKVYVWNMDATLAGTIDVLNSTKNTRPRDADLSYDSYDFIGRHGGGWKTCVRDASWHPDAPIVAATSWNGWGTSLGTCSVHSWNDGLQLDEADVEDGKVEGKARTRRVDEKLREDPALYADRLPRPARQTFGRRRGPLGDDNDD